MNEWLEFVVNSVIVSWNAQWLVYSGWNWMIPRYYHRLYAICESNSTGMICVIGHNLLNEYELDVQRLHSMEMVCTMNGWKKWEKKRKEEVVFIA